MRGRFDIYHATYQRWEPSIRHRALVTTHHDSTQERFPELFRNAAAIHARKRRLYHRADMIICVSESARRDLIEIYGPPESRTRVVHHGVTPVVACASEREDEGVVILAFSPEVHSRTRAGHGPAHNVAPRPGNLTDSITSGDGSCPSALDLDRPRGGFLSAPPTRIVVARAAHASSRGRSVVPSRCTFEASGTEKECR